MRRSPLAPEAHLFVCANRRPPNDPLGAGCGEVGDLTFDALKKEAVRQGVLRTVWVTKTHCLGLCPKTGCGVTSYGPGHAQLFLEVTPHDAPMLVSAAGAAAQSRGAS